MYLLLSLSIIGKTVDKVKEDVQNVGSVQQMNAPAFFILNWRIMMDKELAILEEIHSNNSISQREVSERTGLSLGSVNLLLKKMAKEGLVKMEQIPANRVAYMLTPKGMLEKANKTYSYITKHYAYIEEQRVAMESALKKILEQQEKIQVLLFNDGASEIVKLAINGLEKEEKEKIIQIEEKSQERLEKDLLLIVAREDERELSNYRVVNLLKIM